LYQHLCQYDAAAWRAALNAITPDIAEIDRNATRIWFAFYPLELHTALEAAEARGDLPDTQRKLGLMGRWRLADQVDSSHRFLFAHRHWPKVKAAAAALDPRADSLDALIARLADAAAQSAGVDRHTLLGIAAVALMTLRQAGPEAFAAAPGAVHLPDAARAKSARQIMRQRARDDWQGLFGFTRGMMKRWTVTFDESDPESRFTVINDQELASAAQADKREYRSKDIRCIPNEGPIPVECRAASCGTCWVGVIGGAGKLSPVDAHERKRVKVFGYTETDGERPLIRLACQAKGHGAVSIVIPPWNGIIGRLGR
jgi:ferredoxin